GANDSLVGALVLAAMLVSSRPVARGAVVALAGLTKFAPLALLPLVATYRRGRRGALVTALAAVSVAAVVLAPFDLGTLWSRTLGFQAGRASPFAIWGRSDGLAAFQVAAQVATVALAGLVAFVPRRRDLPTLCGLAASVLIATQLALGYWFYLYVVWFIALT